MRTQSLYCLILTLFLIFSAELKADTQDDKKNNVKVNMLPMLGDRLCLSWERSVFKSRSIELGVEGLGMFSNKDGYPKGVIASVGMRFYQLMKDDDGNVHPMSGLYFYPTLKAGYASYIQTYAGGLRESLSSNYFLGLLQLGQQFVLHKRFCLDLSIGAGGCIQDNPAVYNSSEKPYFQFGFLGSNSATSSFVVTGSVKLGYAFN